MQSTDHSVSNGGNRLKIGRKMAEIFLFFKKKIKKEMRPGRAVQKSHPGGRPETELFLSFALAVYSIVSYCSQHVLRIYHLFMTFVCKHSYFDVSTHIFGWSYGASFRQCFNISLIHVLGIPSRYIYTRLK